jgi:hypothetical protein
MGDVAGAQAASGMAKRFAMWGAVVGVIVDPLSVVFSVALGGMGTRLNTGTRF